MQTPKADWRRKIPMYFIVTDLWFDPVAGQEDPIKGQMVGFQQLGPDGEPRGTKSATPIRGLASQQYEYADMDYIAMCKHRSTALDTGKVVGLGYGRTIRQRPKLPGSRL
jgi:hypothetical protein